MENNNEFKLKELLTLYRKYLIQSHQDKLCVNTGYHENGHDNSGGHPDYHNNSHDNTLGIAKIKKLK